MHNMYIKLSRSLQKITMANFCFRWRFCYPEVPGAPPFLCFNRRCNLINDSLEMTLNLRKYSKLLPVILPKYRQMREMVLSDSVSTNYFMVTHVINLTCMCHVIFVGRPKLVCWSHSLVYGSTIQAKTKKKQLSMIVLSATVTFTLYSLNALM